MTTIPHISPQPASWQAQAMRWHRALAWVAGVVLVLWCSSGLIHTYLSLFGPQQQVFQAPQRPLQLQGMKPIADTLRQAQIDQVSMVRIVVGEDENLLQVTQDAGQARRYFRLSDGLELKDQDYKQALFLARHFMGLPETPVHEVRKISDFNGEYPSVNRLLPVYRVSFDNDDDTVVFVYTETGVLAGVNNRLKSQLQTVFRYLHSASWLGEINEVVRVLLVGLLMSALLVTALAGLGLLIGVRRKTPAPGVKHWHRGAAYLLSLPLLLLAISGLWHLLQNAGPKPASNLRLSAPMKVDQMDFALHTQWSQITQGLNVQGLSLVRSHESQQWMYRLSLAKSLDKQPTTPQEIRKARFDGRSPLAEPLYLMANSGEVWRQGDRELALQLGEGFTGVPRQAIESVELVTRFGPEYDFRNKRVPVWRLNYGAPVNASVFVDTATGVLADISPDAAKAERWSFSYLHKWNFLSVWGRQVHNGVVSGFVLAILLMFGVLGLRMAYKGRAVAKPSSAALAR